MIDDQAKEQDLEGIAEEAPTKKEGGNNPIYGFFSALFKPIIDIYKGLTDVGAAVGEQLNKPIEGYNQPEKKEAKPALAGGH